MDFFLDFLTKLLTQFQSPTMGFLIGGMLLAAFKSKLTIPHPIYQFIVFMLLMKIGLKGGIEIKNANLSEMFLPALTSLFLGLLIVLIGSSFFSMISSIKKEDAIATSGLFGAVSASTLAVVLVLLESESLRYEAWVPALYPFMDIPALILAVTLADFHLDKKKGSGQRREKKVLSIIKSSLRGSALSALLLGLFLGLFTKPEGIYSEFYQPLFKGFLSILMLVMGMEAYSRIKELKNVAQWYVFYGVVAPIVHGLIAFGLGYAVHLVTGFSPGGVVILSVLAASNSDISGPPTLRSAIPSANPSTYLGTSTSVGTPVAVAICIPLFLALAKSVFNLN